MLVAVGVAATALAGPWNPPFGAQGEPPEQTAPAPVLPTETAPPDLEREVLAELDVEPWDLSWIGMVLVALLLLAVAYVALRVVRRLRATHRGTAPPDPSDVAAAGVVGGPLALPDLPALREGVDGAVAHLRVEQAPADAVIAAWVSVEEAAGRSGVVRDPAATPSEFTVTVLDRTAADRDATRTLLRLYLQARFGVEPLGSDDVRTAAGAAEALAVSLRARDEPDDERPDDERPDDAQPDDGGPSGGTHQ